MAAKSKGSYDEAARGARPQSGLHKARQSANRIRNVRGFEISAIQIFVLNCLLVRSIHHPPAAFAAFAVVQKCFSEAANSGDVTMFLTARPNPSESGFPKPAG